MKIELIKNSLDGIEVLFDGVNYGVFEKFESDLYVYFPRRQERLTGDLYIAIGEALNTLNCSEKRL